MNMNLFSGNCLSCNESVFSYLHRNVPLSLQLCFAKNSLILVSNTFAATYGTFLDNSIVLFPSLYQTVQRLFPCLSCFVSCFGVWFIFLITIAFLVED